MSTSGGESRVDTPLVVFLAVEFVTEQQSGNNELAGMKESFYGYTLSAVAGIQDWVPVIPFADKKKAKMRVPQNTMSLI